MVDNFKCFNENLILLFLCLTCLNILLVKHFAEGYKCLMLFILYNIMYGKKSWNLLRSNKIYILLIITQAGTKRGNLFEFSNSNSIGRYDAHW